MIQRMITVRAEINTNGVVTLLEPVKIGKRSRAKVIVYDESPIDQEVTGNAAKLLALMNANRLSEDERISSDEMAKQIAEARSSWD